MFPRNTTFTVCFFLPAFPHPHMIAVLAGGAAVPSLRYTYDSTFPPLLPHEPPHCRIAFRMARSYGQAFALQSPRSFQTVFSSSLFFFLSRIFSLLQLFIPLTFLNSGPPDRIPRLLGRRFVLVPQVCRSSFLNPHFPARRLGNCHGDKHHLHRSSMD